MHRLAQPRQRVTRLRLSRGPTILPCDVVDDDMIWKDALANSQIVHIPDEHYHESAYIRARPVWAVGRQRCARWR